MPRHRNVPQLEKVESGVDRRTLLKALGFTASGIGVSLSGIAPALPAVGPARKIIGKPGAFKRCRLVVFGSDSLRIDYARRLRRRGAKALKALNPPIQATCGGKSDTKAGWASIWSGLPSEWNKTWSNGRMERMPAGLHLVEQLAGAYAGRDFYIVWITGKGKNINGGIRQSTHYAVNKLIKIDGHPGVYHGDKERTNREVHSVAKRSLRRAVTHNNYICFVHFRDPDRTGHVVVNKNRPNKLGRYLTAARKVDTFIADLMTILPPTTDVIYCSDHGFDFKGHGDCRNGHKFSPYGMLATNFSTLPKRNVSQEAIGRLIYRVGGGDPNCTTSASLGDYSLSGENLV